MKLDYDRLKLAGKDPHCWQVCEPVPDGTSPHPIQTRREDAGLSRWELAYLSKVHYSHIAGIEEFRHTPSRLALKRIEEALE